MPVEEVHHRHSGGSRDGIEMSTVKTAQDADSRTLLEEEESGGGERSAVAQSSRTGALRGGHGGGGPLDWLKRAYAGDPLLFLTISGVCVGILFGLILMATLPQERSVAIRIIGLPGTILLNLLKMMVLPLISGSMVAGVCALQGSGAATGKLARLTIAYFSGTTIIAVILGLVVVIVIEPGSGGLGDLDEGGGKKPNAGSADLLDTTLGVLLKMFPPNIVAAAVEMNVLGVISFSLFFGVMLSRLGPRAASMIAAVDIFNEVIMAMVMAILWLAPFGIACLIAAQMAVSPNLLKVLSALGKYVACVCGALLIHGGVILPAVFYLCTKKNPVPFMRGVSQALATAFGTDSSSATLPVSMMCCERNNGVSPLVSKFVLPLAATVNMNGTALYEALTVIFIAQLHGVQLSIGQLIVVALTSTLAAVGAAAIPSAGLVTMVMVLQSAGLDMYVSDLGIIFTIDWALDRVRTTVNVLGDCLGAGIMQHLCGDMLRESDTHYDGVSDMSDRDRAGFPSEGGERSV